MGLKKTNPKVEKGEVEEVKRMNLIAFLKGMGFHPHWERGHRAMFLSPLREEKNPSFSVQMTRDGVWTWKDWGTGESGDIIKFLQLYYGVSFKEALEKLGNFDVRSYEPADRYQRAEKKSNDWVKEFYRKEVSKMSGRKLDVVRNYFLNLGVRYHPEMGCIPVKDLKDGKHYVGIPIPYPLKMRGLELREVGGNAKKTWGKKTLWLLKRDLRRILITESILDALAGEIVFGDESMTLCSLNGVGNVEQLDALFDIYKPEEVLLALDNDGPGQSALAEAFGIGTTKNIRVINIVRDHVRAGVKDLHKLLLLKEEVALYGKYDLSEVRGASAFLS